MDQQELLYGYSSLLIVAILFVAINCFNELGFRLGHYVQSRTNSEIKALTGSIQGSILGLLALLLGFTFSMAIQRHDTRSHALIDEANAIGTALLRIQLLPQQFQNEAHNSFKKYVDQRVSMTQLDLTETSSRAEFHQEVLATQNALWSIAIAATEADPRPVTSGAFVKALNDMIDNQGKRNALLQMHVPEIVLILLFIVFISSGAFMGYAAGLSGKRLTAPIVLVSLLITLIVFIIIDLDRPKRGIIQVNQAPLFELQQTLQ